MSQHKYIATIVDFTEKATLSIIFGYAFVRIAPSLADKPFNAIFLFSEFLGLALVLTRKSGNLALAPYPIAIAYIGTVLPLLCSPGPQLISKEVGVTLMISGLCLSVTSKLFLNTSFGFLAANRGIKSSGPYIIIRHPMYAGYIITQIGFLSVNYSLSNAIFILAGWVFFVLRIIEEERFLISDAAYADYSSRVRYRLIPKVF